MSEAKREPEFIRRILVAFDNSGHSLAALEAAVELAARLNVELLGLFVEDINLIRLAGLPFVQAIHYPWASTRPLDSQKLEQELEARATQARRAVATAAEQAHVRWSFRVARGQVALEVLAAASDVDLLSLGIAGQLTIQRRARLGSTARAVAARAPGAVLLLQQGEKIGPQVMVVYDGTAAAQRALALAVLLRVTPRSGTLPALIVLTPTEDRVDIDPYLEQEAGAWLTEQGVEPKFRRLAKMDVLNLAQAVGESIAAEKGGLLILSSESLIRFGPETIQALLDKIDCPLLLVK